MNEIVLLKRMQILILKFKRSVLFFRTKPELTKLVTHTLNDYRQKQKSSCRNNKCKYQLLPRRENEVYEFFDRHTDSNWDQKKRALPEDW